MNSRSGNSANDKTVGAVVRGLLLIFLAMAATGTASAQDYTALRFKGGIGVIPVTGVTPSGTVSLNLVRGVSPAGPWCPASAGNGESVRPLR